MEKLLIQLQFRINLPTILVMIYLIQIKIGQIYLKILQIRIRIIAYTFFLNY